MKTHTPPWVLTLSGLCLGLALWAGAAAPVYAERMDHEQARQALQEGKVLSLRSILDKVEQQYPGQVVEVEFESKHGQYVYDVRLLQTDGAILKITLDAVDGKVLRTKQKSRH
ncbi:MAG: PepSY domain-containing protein [Comamonas sp.]|nr:PepSY domain-containing protein [Comamonas sp.]